MAEGEWFESPETEVEWREMQAALGRAISAWGSIEGHLSLIFERAVTARRSSAASAAFSAILSYEAQLAMTDAAMKVTFSKSAETIEQKKMLRKRIDKLRPRRNKIAHGQIVRQLKGNEPMTIRFMPFYHVHHHRGADAFEHLSITDLNKLHDAFQELAHDLWEFAQSISWSEMRQKLSLFPLSQSDRA